MKQKRIYYTDELNDEFSSAQITPRRIDGNYRYIRDGFFGRLAHIFAYRVVAEPLGFLGMKLIYHHRIVNRKVLKQAGKSGYFLYGNHTNAGADPFVPSYVAFPRAPYVIVHPNNVSIPVVGPVIHYLGALPLPDDKEAMKHFTEAIRTRIQQKKPVVIYPEAHIWPYYTDIRPFKDTSFQYPLSLDVPVFCFTNTYRKKRLGFGPKMVTYVDGPFYPKKCHEDGTPMKPKEQRKELRDRVYETMKLRAQNNSVVLIDYIKKEQSDD